MFGGSSPLACHLLNIIPLSTLQNENPYHKRLNKKLSYSHLRVFGCLCYPNTSATATHKLSPRSSACVYLGPASDHKGHRCLDLITQRVIISRHVVFDEDHFPFFDFHRPTASNEYDPLEHDDPSPLVIFSIPDHTDHTDHADHTSDTPASPAPPVPSSHAPPPPASIGTSSHSMVTRLRTSSLKPRQLMNLSATTDISPIPRSTPQAMCDPN